MNDSGTDYFPLVCRGCIENCYRCVKTVNSVPAPLLRELAASRKLKLQSIERMQRDIELIDCKLRLLTGNI